MPQEFFVGKCFSCQKFQVHQVRKDKKFVCKVCGIKQSVKKIYYAGDAKSCRKEVMMLNSLQGFSNQGCSDVFSESKKVHIESVPLSAVTNPFIDEENDVKQISKWSKYIEDESDEHVSGSTETTKEEFRYPQIRRGVQTILEDVRPVTDELDKNKSSQASKKRKKCAEAESSDLAQTIALSSNKLKIYEKYQMLDDLDFNL